MRLISLDLENFLKFERLALEFPDGLMGVLGPNGVGKSSLVEAIAWALYGSPVSRTRNEGLPFRRNVPCRVALTLEIEGDEYRVVRELRGASLTAHAEVSVNGVPAEVGTERTNRLIASRLRMDHRAFMVSFFARQKELDALVAWEPRDRKRYILRMLGLERVDRAIEALRRDITDAERDLRAREAALPSLEAIQEARKAARERVAVLTRQREEAQAALDATERELSEARQRLDEMEAQQRRYTAAERTRDLARQALEAARREEAIYADHVRDLQAKQEELRRLEPSLQPLLELRARRQAMELAAGLQRRRNALVRTIAHYERTGQDLLGQAATLSKDLSTRDGLQVAHDQAEALLAQARAELTDLQGQIRTSEGRLMQIKREQQQLTRDLKSVKELGAAGRCPTCQRILNASYTEVVTHLEGELKALGGERDEYARFLAEDSARATQLQRQVADAEAERQRLNLALRRVAQAEARLSEVQSAIARNTAELARAQAELTEMGEQEYDPATHQRLLAQLATLEKMEHRVIGLRQEVERLPMEEQALARARQAIPERQATLDRAEEELRTLGFNPTAYAQHRQICRTLEARREARSQEFHRADRERERALAEQQQADTRHDDYERQVEIIRERRLEKENRDELLALISAFRVDLIGRIRPALATKASRLVRDLTDGKYDQIELDEDYNLWMHDEGERRELRSFSGGENDLVHLCLRLAISQMIAESAGGAEHGFLVLDEVLGSQDGERRGLILQALAVLSRQFRQILMITHLDDVKEMVEHAIELRELPNGSSEVVASDEI
ncbi:MAG TPA: SMC family ATPase [Armatimonadetes bacterium]|jgi:exonuclease SbcC|nr:SMC family ATPase [Armatimonadota bacterium]